MIPINHDMLNSFYYLAGGTLSSTVGLIIEEKNHSVFNIIGKSLQNLGMICNVRSLALDLFRGFRNFHYYYPAPASLLFSPITLGTAAGLPLVLHGIKTLTGPGRITNIINTLEKTSDMVVKGANTYIITSTAFAINPIFGITVGAVYTGWSLYHMSNNEHGSVV